MKIVYEFFQFWESQRNNFERLTLVNFHKKYLKIKSVASIWFSFLEWLTITAVLYGISIKFNLLSATILFVISIVVLLIFYFYSILEILDNYSEKVIHSFSINTIGVIAIIVVVTLFYSLASFSTLIVRFSDVMVK